MLMRARPLVDSLIIGLGLLLVSCGSNGPTEPSAPAPSGQTSIGPIAFVSDRDGTDQIYLANGDGSAVSRLTAGAAPAWLRGGQRLAFYRAQAIYVINVDGFGLRRVAAGWEPAGSPDGRMLVFRGRSGIEVVDVDGSNHRVLYNDGGYGSFHPAWSPDGRQIAFSVGTYVDDGLGLWVMNADGSDPHHIGPDDGEVPAWSADSSKIAFVAPPGSIGLVKADGSGRRLLVADKATGVDWTPDARLIFTRSPSGDSGAPGRRVFITDGGVERQLIPEVAAPARFPGYSDSQATWLR
jgi:Tol biopolymer transport system component